MYNQRNDYIKIHNVFTNSHSHLQTFFILAMPPMGVRARSNSLFLGTFYTLLWLYSLEGQACTHTMTFGKQLENQSTCSGLLL